MAQRLEAAIAAETVRAPQPHEGVGRALRDAFSPAAPDLPAAWLGLLDRMA